MNLSLRRSTCALLISSLLLTIGRGATLPFMTIYLSRQYGLSVDLIGYAMTIALTIGVVFSLGFGILADKFDKKRYMVLAIVAFGSGFIAIPLVHNVSLVVSFSLRDIEVSEETHHTINKRRYIMLDNINIFMAVLGIILFSGFLAAYFSHKWDN